MILLVPVGRDLRISSLSMPPAQRSGSGCPEPPVTGASGHRNARLPWLRASVSGPFPSPLDAPVLAATAFRSITQPGYLR